MEPAWLAAGAAAVSAVGAWWAAFNGVRTLRQTRIDSKNRSRPMLAAELRKMPYVKGSQALVIRNFGPTVARNLRVAFDPPVPDPHPDEAAQSVTPFLKRRYAEPISTVTPGMELVNVWFVAVRGSGSVWENAEPTPDRCTVKLSYESTTGDRYEDHFVIDVGLLRTETFSTSSTAPEALLKDAIKSVKSMDRSLAALASERAGAVDSGPRGLPQEFKDRLLGHQREER